MNTVLPFLVCIFIISPKNCRGVNSFDSMFLQIDIPEERGGSTPAVLGLKRQRVASVLLQRSCYFVRKLS